MLLGSNTFTYFEVLIEKSRVRCVCGYMRFDFAACGGRDGVINWHCVVTRQSSNESIRVHECEMSRRQDHRVRKS